MNNPVEKKLVLVIGAGASSELGLPVGSELKAKIAELLDIRFDNKQISGDYEIAEALRVALRQSSVARPDINGYLGAAWAIRDAMPQAISIDHFIDSRRGDEKTELCGKLAIVRSILHAEQRSTIHLNPRNRSKINYAYTETSWLNPFMRLLTENCQSSDLKDRLNSVAFIIFNYDRCIEHYMYHWLQTYYGLSEAAASELLAGISIYHPYGSIGALPWQARGGSVGFGEEIERERLLESAKRIKTFTEGTDPTSSEITEIRQTVAAARNLLFLGFAFHKLNMQLLKLDGKRQPFHGISRVFATAKGISNFDVDDIASEISDMRACKRDLIQIRNDLTCHDVFYEYARSISLTS